jgi:hypothetical protein
MRREQIFALGAVVVVFVYGVWAVGSLGSIFSAPAAAAAAPAARGPLLVTVAPATAVAPLTSAAIAAPAVPTATAALATGVAPTATEALTPTAAPMATAVPPTPTVAPTVTAAPTLAPTVVVTASAVTTPTGAAPAITTTQTTTTTAPAANPTQTTATGKPAATTTPIPGINPPKAVAPSGKLLWLPGVTLDDLTAKLKAAFGLECSGPVDVGGLLNWSCERTMPDGKTRLSVLIIGLDPNRITSVSGLVTQTDGPDDKAAADFLSFLARLPFANGNADRAAQWVEKRIGTGGQTIIGGVMLSLSGTPGSRAIDLYAPQTTRGSG